MVGTKARAVCIAVLVASAVLAPAVASAATYNRWYLRNSNTSGIGDFAFNYGDGTQMPLAGDWNGDGRDTPGVFRSGTWWLSNFFDGTTQAYFAYGSPGMYPVVGDWNGNRTVTVGVKTGLQWHVSNSNSSAPASSVFNFGNPSGDIPLSGDWDGNGTQTPGIWRTSNHAFYLSNSPTGSLVSGITFGAAGDVPIVGDWNGDGRDSIGVYRPSTGRWYLSNGLDTVGEIVFVYGNPNDKPVVGDWDANGTDTPGVVRTFTVPTTPPPPAPPVEVADSLHASVEIPDDEDDLAADADDSEPYPDEDEVTLRAAAVAGDEDADLTVHDVAAERARTQDGSTTMLVPEDPFVEVGAEAASGSGGPGPGSCKPSRRRKGSVVYRPVRLTDDSEQGYTTNQLRVFKQKRADRVYYPNLGRPVTVKDFIGCVTGGAIADDGWRLKRYYNLVYAKTEIERLILPARWGTGVQDSNVSVSLGFALNAGVVNVNSAVQSTNRDVHGGAVGPFCWTYWSGGPCYPQWPDYEKNMVRSYWEGGGFGSPSWQGNTAIAQYQLPQSRRNIKLDFNVYLHWLDVG